MRLSKTKKPIWVRSADMSEDSIQSAYIGWCRLRARGKDPIRELRLAYHAANGSHKSPAARVRFQNLGQLAGVPDIFLPVPSGGYPGLYIEFKSRKGRLSKVQEELIEELRLQGYKVIVSRDWTHAANETLIYLGKEPEFDEGS